MGGVFEMLGGMKAKSTWSTRVSRAKARKGRGGGFVRWESFQAVDGSHQPPSIQINSQTLCRVGATSRIQRPFDLG